MRWRKQIYVAHRWLGLVISAQLLAWSVGGFVFSILDIDEVRGDLDRRQQAPAVLRPADVQITPAQALNALAATSTDHEPVVELRLVERDDRAVYDVLTIDNRAIAVVDALTGLVVSPISATDAERIALQDFTHAAKVASASLIERDPPVEYRGKTLPAYQVVLVHPQSPHIYVSAITGEVLSRRNRLWRIFDFFWMLHIMDYGGRENFNHPLLMIASLIAVLTSLTGLLLWLYRWMFRRKRLRPRSGSPDLPGPSSTSIA